MRADNRFAFCFNLYLKIESERSRIMRNVIVGLFCLFGTFTAVSQTDGAASAIQSSTIKVSIEKEAKGNETTVPEFKKIAHDKREAACFIDMKQVSLETLSNGINPDDIEKVNVKKGDTLINGRKYNGKIFVSTKHKKPIEWMTLSEIKQQFTITKNPETIYTINGKYLEKEEAFYLIDKEYILKAYLLSDINPYLKDKPIDIVNILTKVKENKKPKIILRGNEVSETE